MILVDINGMLNKQKKTKYWLIKNMGSSYQALSRLINNETAGIKFDTLEKICDVLNCEPGDIIIRKKYVKRKKVK
jgi:putative transcriptional regulator